MSNHPNHSQKSSTESDPDEAVYCCRLCQLEADGGRRATASSSEHAQHDHDTASGHSHGGIEHDHTDEAEHDHDAHGHDAHDHDVHGHGGGHEGAGHGGGHEAHTDHSGHEQMFRRRFWVSLALSVPVIVFSEFIQGVFGYTAPTFPGSVWLTSSRA